MNGAAGPHAVPEGGARPDKPTADDVIDGEALPGTRVLEELINNVFRENKGEDLDIETLRELRQRLRNWVEALKSVTNRRGA